MVNFSDRDSSVQNILFQFLFLKRFVAVKAKQTVNLFLCMQNKDYVFLDIVQYQAVQCP